MPCSTKSPHWSNGRARCRRLGRASSICRARCRSHAQQHQRYFRWSRRRQAGRPLHHRGQHRGTDPSRRCAPVTSAGRASFGAAFFYDRDRSSRWPRYCPRWTVTFQAKLDDRRQGAAGLHAGRRDRAGHRRRSRPGRSAAQLPGRPALPRWWANSRNCGHHGPLPRPPTPGVAGPSRALSTARRRRALPGTGAGTAGRWPTLDTLAGIRDRSEASGTKDPSIAPRRHRHVAHPGRQAEHRPARAGCARATAAGDDADSRDRPGTTCSNACVPIYWIRPRPATSQA